MVAAQTAVTAAESLGLGSCYIGDIMENYEEHKRLFDLPDYVFFNHSIHVNKGIGCESCHGRVDQMALVYKDQSMFMQWCLDCHRDPAKNIRPVQEIYTFGYIPDIPQEVLGPDLIKEYEIHYSPLENCYICHR